MTRFYDLNQCTGCGDAPQFVVEYRTPIHRWVPACSGCKLLSAVNWVTIACAVKHYAITAALVGHLVLYLRDLENLSKPVNVKTRRLTPQQLHEAVEEGRQLRRDLDLRTRHLTTLDNDAKFGIVK